MNFQTFEYGHTCLTSLELVLFMLNGNRYRCRDLQTFKYGQTCLKPPELVKFMINGRRYCSTISINLFC